MDLLEYMHWRGDLSFTQSPFNEIDSLIFSTLVYESFDEILKKGTSLTIQETASLFFNRYDEKDLKARKTFSNRSYEILKAMANTLRYKDLILSHYVNEIDDQLDLQFCALTITHPKHFHYIAYRGTDDTMTGWKEDFCMLYKDAIPSQIKALEYFQKIQTKRKFHLFHNEVYYLGGHSKGGNLAMYVALVSHHKDILRVDNFDGPGFDENFFHQYPPLKNITTYLPESSFFGRLFTHKEKTVVFKSDQRGLLQHLPFYWKIDVTRLQRIQKNSEASDHAISRFHDLINSYQHSQKEVLVESLFAVFKNLNIHSLSDLTSISFNQVIQSLKEFNELNAETKKVIRECLSILLEITDIKSGSL